MRNKIDNIAICYLSVVTGFSTKFVLTPRIFSRRVAVSRWTLVKRSRQFLLRKTSRFTRGAWYRAGNKSRGAPELLPKRNPLGPLLAVTMFFRKRDIERNFSRREADK